MPDLVRDQLQTALELIDNINAMELAVGRAVEVERFGVEEIIAIHTRLMLHAPNKHLAGSVRTEQNWGHRGQVLCARPDPKPCDPKPCCVRGSDPDLVTWTVRSPL